MENSREVIGLSVEDFLKEEDDLIFNYDNYFMYAELAKNGEMTIDVSTINEANYDQHYYGILNLMKDTISNSFIKDARVTLAFKDCVKTCKMSIPDYWMNIIMWYVIVKTGRYVQPKHIFYEASVTRGNVKKYIDKYFIDEFTTTLDIVDMNNIIDDTLHRLYDIDNFSMFLANTINLEDFVDLMYENHRFWECIHADIGSDVPLDKNKSVGTDYTNEAINIIKKTKHCLANFFRAKEGIKDKQFKEFCINIGPKPDGNGGAFPVAVNTNFLLGGVNDLLSFYIESSNGRTAQIIVENNVGDSGYFARLLGVNNIDTKIHPDPNYDCGTRNFVKVFIKDQKRLNTLGEYRNYRLSPNGMEFQLKSTDTHLIGKTIYLRSPMTCKSAAEGKGICYKCYGRLAYIIKHINAGKISAELLSSILTQMMLSAKHLLEAAVVSFKWNPEFIDLFTVEFNNIVLKKDFDYTGYKMIINRDEISLASEDDAGEMNEYVTSFNIMYPDGHIVKMTTSECNNMFLTIELNNAIRSYGEPNNESDDDEIILDLNKVKNGLLFAMEILNNDLNKTLNNIRNTLNTKSYTDNYTKDEILEALLDNLDEGHMSLNSVHAEVILSNQIRSKDNILENPDWGRPNEDYQILTLKSALKNVNSITKTLAFEGIKSALYNPLTFKKNGQSCLDVFFMEQPQNMDNMDTELYPKAIKYKGKELLFKRIPEKTK